jgi:hypothetical protein
MRELIELLPLQIRVLYRQFLLRVIDLEALSIEADIPRFLGQFASVLIFISLMGAWGLLSGEAATATPEGYLNFSGHGEQALISGMMLVVGLIAVITWDSTFPDRRDVMVLSPLPVAAHTILLAKVAASAALLGLAILSLNFATGLAWPLLIGSHHGSILGFLQSFAAYWLTMIAASIFIYGSVLTLQGVTALLLPRRLFLRASAVLQIVAFTWLLGDYFLQPSIPTPAAMTLAENRWALAWSPSFWFFGFFHQLNGSLPPALEGLARRGWIGLSIVIFGATASLFLCYLRTMKKTAEEPDLLPGGWHWTPRLGCALETAVVLFSLRSLTRSRQHRVIFAFYLALAYGFAFSSLKDALSVRARPLDSGFLISTFMMMTLVVAGLRSVFSLPISLTANWIWRITQLRPSENYLAATRTTLLLLGVGPAWVASGLLSVSLRPLTHVAAHLAILLIVGWIFVELSLIGLHKVPFTCSYLPGKVHVQVMLWVFLFLLLILGMSTAELELPALSHAVRYLSMIAVLGATGLGLWYFNRKRAKSALLDFEEPPTEIITKLGLVWLPGTGSQPTGTR